MAIFRDFAPLYWEKNLPVIPLAPNSKRPLPMNWQRYADEMPELDVAQGWVAAHANGNIGLALGPQSKMMGLDIDTDDPVVMKCLQMLLPKTPWVRVGKKGAVWAYRFDGQKTFRIKDENNKTLVELLSKGTQIVIPPSIHPETMQPYEANCFLPEVIDSLPSVGQDIEAILRGALEAAGIKLSHSGWTRVSEFVPIGARDNAMVSHAGILARAITRGERTLRESFGEMDHWIKNFTEKVDGDPLDPEKAQQRIVQFLLRDVLGERRKALPIGWDEGLTQEEKLKLGLVIAAEHEQWDFERIKGYMVTEFANHGPGTIGRNTAVQYALDILARSISINILDEERLLKWIVDSGGLEMTLKSLRQRLRELRAGDLAGTDHSQIAQAVRKDLIQFGDVKYSVADFWQWKGAMWEQMKTADMLRHIAEDYGALPAAKKSNDHTGILRVMATLKNGPLRERPQLGINFANGYLTSDLELLGHHPSFGMTYTLPYRYMPAEKSGTMARFEAFLARVWGHDPDFADKVKALREAICVTLFGMGPLYGRAILLHGMPMSGKTQLLDIICGLMPDGAVSQIAPGDWGDKFLPMEMQGKLLNRCGDLNENKFIDGDKLKMIIEGGNINGQRKGKDIVPFNPICTHWFASNHLPRTRDSSAGFNRRWLILDFNLPITAGERVQNIANLIIAEEREAIVAWAVAAVADLKGRPELTLPACHFELMNDMANQNNSVRYFLTASGKVRVRHPLAEDFGKTSAPTMEAKLYEAYWSFCVGTAGVQHVGLRSFRAKMRELGGELGFKIRVSMDQKGMEFAEYENLILVGAT